MVHVYLFNSNPEFQKLIHVTSKVRFKNAAVDVRIRYSWSVIFDVNKSRSVFKFKIQEEPHNGTKCSNAFIHLK